MPLPRISHRGSTAISIGGEIHAERGGAFSSHGEHSKIFWRKAAIMLLSSPKSRSATAAKCCLISLLGATKLCECSHF